MLRAARDRRVHHVTRALYVLRNGFADIPFHERHMLVRRGMEDGIRFVLGEDALDALAVANIRDHRDERASWRVREQLVENLENRILAVTKENELLRLESDELAAQLRAD